MPANDLTAGPDREWAERMRTGAMAGWEREWHARREAEGVAQKVVPAAEAAPTPPDWKARALAAEAELARLRGSPENFRDATEVSPPAHHLTCPACGTVNVVAGWYRRRAAAEGPPDNRVRCYGCGEAWEPGAEAQTGRG